jgi:hypothetical protein
LLPQSATQGGRWAMRSSSSSRRIDPGVGEGQGLYAARGPEDQGICGGGGVELMTLIDRMRQWSIVGSVWPLHGPGRQRSHASAGQPGRTEGEDQLGPTTSHLGPCRRRTFRRTLRTNQMCSTNSLRLPSRRRHHRLPGIHCRRYSDRRAAILRGSGPVSGPAGVTRS